MVQVHSPRPFCCLLEPRFLPMCTRLSVPSFVDDVEFEMGEMEEEAARTVDPDGISLQSEDGPVDTLAKANIWGVVVGMAGVNLPLVK